MMPEWSSPSPSSRSEQIIPSEIRPYVFRALIANSPGSTAHGSATTTWSPTPKLVAPQMIPRGFSSRTSTCQYRIGFFSPVSSSRSTTRPNTSGPVTEVRRSVISSTSRPTRTNAASSASGSTGASTYSRSHDTGSRMSDLHPERAGEPDVALHYVPHVTDPVSEHQRALDTHSERESAVLVWIDPTGA